MATPPPYYAGVQPGSPTMPQGMPQYYTGSGSMPQQGIVMMAMPPQSGMPYNPYDQQQIAMQMQMQQQMMMQQQMAMAAMANANRQSPTIVNNVSSSASASASASVHGGTAEPNHACHCLCTLVTSGIWLPIWILACLGCCDPCPKR